MKHILVIFALALTPALAHAEDAPATGGLSTMEEAFRLFLKGLNDELDPLKEDLEGMIDEVEPTLREFAESLGPKLGDLADQIDDYRNYELPEVLPNGDIIIRRRQDAPELAPLPDGQIDI